MNSYYPKTLPDAEVYEENNRRKQNHLFGYIRFHCDSV